jgi:hypothetical protein
MSTTETLERHLLHDLEWLGDRLADDRLVADLYRALTNHALFERDGDTDGHISLSWNRAAEVLNSARAARALPAVDGLPQSGGEGELTRRARETLERLGWEARPLNAGRHDERHTGEPESPPTADRTPPEWERTAHAEADEARRTPPKL